MPQPQMPQSQSAPLKVWFLSGLITLGVVAGIGRLIISLWPAPVTRAAEAVDFEDSLQGKAAVIAQESTYLSEAACPERDRLSFEALKSEGMMAQAEKDYANAERKFELAASLCSAPEVMIALNNARIGAGEARSLVVTVPFSGSNANNAIEMLRGFAQAQDEVNKAGGINGVPLKLLVADDGDSEETARELAIALTSDPQYDHVLGVVGHWTSDVSLKAAAIYRDRKRLVFMTPISTTKELSGYSPWVFRATINNRSGAAALAQHMLKTWGLKKAAVFYVDGVTYSEEIADEFAAILEGSSWGEVVNAADMGDPSFRPKHSVEQAKKAGAEVILLATNNGSLEDAIAVIKANKGQLKILGDLANLYTPKTLEDTGLVSEGMTMAVAWDIDGETNPAFVQQANTQWKGPVNYVTAMSYGAVKAMAAAIGQSPTRNGVQSALSQENFQVLGAAKSPMEFVRGDLQTKVQLVEVTKIADSTAGATPLDFVPLKPQPTSVRSSQHTPNRGYRYRSP